MTLATLNQERFQQNDIPTRLSRLAAHLDQIGLLASDVTQGTVAATLTRESIYYIEWTVPHIVDKDIDQAAELVDLGRILARWLFKWETIWFNGEVRSEITQVTRNWSERVKSL